MSQSPIRPASAQGRVSLKASLRLLPLPPLCLELNLVERFGGVLKAAVANRLCSMRTVTPRGIGAVAPH